MLIFTIMVFCLIFFSFNAYTLTKNINNQIKEIGSVTVNSEDTISDLEQKYDGFNNFQKLFVYKYNDLAKARKTFNSLPIPLTIDNIGKYISYDVKFKDYFESIGKPIFFGDPTYRYYDASANADVATITLKDVYFDNVIIKLKIGMELVKNLGSWNGDEITLKLSPDGLAQSSGHLRYSVPIFPPPSMPQYKGMEIISVSGNIYNDKKNH